jgi:hypothetical protein
VAFAAVRCFWRETESDLWNVVDGVVVVGVVIVAAWVGVVVYVVLWKIVWVVE